jgi:peptidoglycan-N-acetylglucosamine deacetylase
VRLTSTRQLGRPLGSGPSGNGGASLPHAALALAAAVALATGLALGGGSEGSAGASETHTGSHPTNGASNSPAPAPGAGQVRYRPVGCIRRGPADAYRNGPPRKVVALSFDDGPSLLTPRFVKMLSANRAVATFFMIGRQVTAGFQSVLHAELREGDALGDHTWSHPDLLLAGDVRGQLAMTLQRIRALSGYTPCVFRPPYGDYDAAVVQTARSLGLGTVLWDVDPSDYTLPGIGVIVRRVLEQVRPGSIILSHDGGGPRSQTLAAYPLIIRTLRARGYRFETVPELLGFRTVYKRCVRDCEDAAITGQPPPGSIIEPGATPP